MDLRKRLTQVKNEAPVNPAGESGDDFWSYDAPSFDDQPVPVAPSRPAVAPPPPPLILEEAGRFLESVNQQLYPVDEGALMPEAALPVTSHLPPLVSSLDPTALAESTSRADLPDFAFSTEWQAWDGPPPSVLPSEGPPVALYETTLDLTPTDTDNLSGMYQPEDPYQPVFNDAAFFPGPETPMSEEAEDDHSWMDELAELDAGDSEALESTPTPFPTPVVPPTPLPLEVPVQPELAARSPVERLVEPRLTTAQLPGSPLPELDILHTCSIATRTHLFLVAMGGQTALMGQSGEGVGVLHVFHGNPLSHDDTFAVSHEGQRGPHAVYLARIGAWRGVLEVEAPQSIRLAYVLCDER